MNDTPLQSLQNTFLVAMPSMADPRFKHCVTYICEHNNSGAMGLVINQPTNLTVGELLDQIDIENNKMALSSSVPVLSGGPVHTDRGFVLHTTKPGYSSSAQISSDIMVTSSKDILHEITSYEAPEKFIITLGYAGWDQGQLEQELIDNTWLNVPADPDLIFNTPAHLRWQKAIESLGIDIDKLTQYSGHA
jgi:putative transcriptional regulator